MSKCPNCQQLKVENLKLGSLTQINEVPTLKWESVHFIPLKSTYRAEDYARLYIDEIVRWQGIPLSIVSDRGVQSLRIS